MHDPDTILFNHLPLLITKTHIKFQSHRASTLREKWKNGPHSLTMHNSLIMHDPGTILFKRLPLLITKAHIKFRFHPASTFREKWENGPHH